MKMRWLLICIFLTSAVNCERLSEQIYSTIEGATGCFRRLNATHQAGCSSGDGGAVGALWLVQSVADARWLAAGGGGGGPYVALISTLHFSQLADTLMTRPDNIAGAILFENSTFEPTFYSDETSCPNNLFSSDGAHCGGTGDSVQWNKYGSGLLRRDIPFPVFYLPLSRGKEVVKLIDCFKRFNAEDRDNHAGRPLCSVQLNSFMFAAVNTEVCMRRSTTVNINPTKQCDPVGDRNIYSALFPRSQDLESEANRSIVLVTARIDSASMFDGLSPGAASSVVGLVTLITAAATLSTMLPYERANEYKRNVVWALFSGESFDYIGSQRVAYDMSHGTWPPNAPLTPELVDLHIELGQLGGDLELKTQEWDVTAFAPLYAAPEDEGITKFIETLQQAEPKLKFTPERTSNLPPSSLHSFRRILGESPATGGLVELLLVDHNKTSFTNNYYQSVLDDKRNINFIYRNKTVDENGNFIDTATMIANGFMTESDMQVKISRLANALARALHQRVTGESYNGTETASAHMVDELLHCYLESAACRIFAASEYGPVEGTADPEMPNEPYPLYTGVHGWYNRAPFSTGLVLALLTGEVTHNVRLDCLRSNDTSYSFHWQHGWNLTGACIRTTMNFTDALSPAFTIPGYDLKSGMYSTWSESVWRSLSARMFVAASGRGARIAATLGALATLLVAMLTYWLHKHCHVIFSQHTPVTIAVNADPSATGILRTVNC